MISHLFSGTNLAWLVVLACGALGICTSTSAAQTAEELRGRTIVTDTKSGMAKFVGLLYFVDTRKGSEGVIRRGTATLIGPRHILTAAHNVYDRSNPHLGKGGFPEKKILFSPGYNMGEMPFGEAGDDGIYIQRAYIDGINPQTVRDADIAVITLNREFFKGERFPAIAAWDEKSLDAFRGKVNCNGYDGDLFKDGKERQVTRTGTARKVRSLLPAGPIPRRPSLFEADWHWYKAASGGPVWVEKDGVPTLVGVNGFTNYSATLQSWGVLIDAFYVDWIKAPLK